MAADTPCVLVVEDETTQREMLAYNLEAEGFMVSRAENGEEALLIVDEVSPDVILLDWMLPNVSGIEVCRRLKSRSDTRQTPIIMLTARGEESERIRGLTTGADDYVVKPFSTPELMARVKAMLRRARPEIVADVCALVTSNWIAKPIGYIATAMKSVWDRPSFVYLNFSCKRRDAYFLGRNCSMAFGAKTSMSMIEQSMFTLGACASRLT